MKLIELKTACGNFALSTSGNKPDLIERLNEYTNIRDEVEAAELAEVAARNAADEAARNPQPKGNAVVVEFDIDDDDDEGEDVAICGQDADPDYVDEEGHNANGKRVREDDEEDGPVTSGKRVRPSYHQVTIYDTPEEAENHLRTEGVWNKRNMRDTVEGRKHWYMCKRCTLKCYILYHTADSRVSIWSSSSEHDAHQAVERVYGLNHVTRQQIDQLYKDGNRTASRILHALRRRNDEFMPKKMDCKLHFLSCFFHI